jgi:hypothetical protein
MEIIKRTDLAFGALLFSLVSALWVIVLPYNQRPEIDPPQSAAERIDGQRDPHDAPARMVEPPGQPKQSGGHGDAPELYGVKPGEFLLFLATVGLWYATARLVSESRTSTRQQLEALQRTADAQSRDMQASIEAAERGVAMAGYAAEASHESNKIAKRTAERQLRAYLSLVDFTMNEERHEFIIVAKNDGQTPALGVTTFFNIQWFPPGQDLPENFAFTDYPQGNRGTGPVTVTPSQSRPWSFPVPWDKIEQFNDGRIGSLYLYGRFTYHDVFGEARRSNFCLEFVRFGDGKGGIRVADRHNDST